MSIAPHDEVQALQRATPIIIPMKCEDALPSLVDRGLSAVAIDPTTGNIEAEVDLPDDV
eukprot:COSAG02_NODE_40885_length_400_cov_1.006645_1_plen_58_part_01